MICIFLGTLAVPARAQCVVRYDAAFARLSGLGQKGLRQEQATAEVTSLFGPRPDSCEAGAYQRFLDAFRDFAGDAMHAPAGKREGMVRVAIAVPQQGPLRVPAAESKAALTAYRQARSDLHAIADDVGPVPLLQQLLDAFDRVGAPVSLPPPAPPQGTDNTQAIRVPNTPLPPWAVISLYEMRDHLRRKDPAGAQVKLDQILKWLEMAP